MDSYRELIRENIRYDILLHDLPDDKDRLDEIVELTTETVCSKRKYIGIAGNDFPVESVKSLFLKIDAEHIKFVFDCLNDTTKVRNIKKYLLTVLYNAPVTMRFRRRSRLPRPAWLRSPSSKRRSSTTLRPARFSMAIRRPATPKSI